MQNAQISSGVSESEEIKIPDLESKSSIAGKIEGSSSMESTFENFSSLNTDQQQTETEK